MARPIAKIVNYAFLQELKEENSSLWEDVLLLGSYSQEPFSSDWIEQNAGPLLRRLRDKLAGQFRMEETLAYIPAPDAVQSNDVTTAFNQHLKILLHCVSLSEMCDDFEYSGKLYRETVEVWQEMRKLYDEIMDHESLERRMLNLSFSPESALIELHDVDQSPDSFERSSIANR
jgi:hypothetical protein